MKRSFAPLREGLGLLRSPAASKPISLPPAQLHYLRLPKDISEDHVILMDCTVSTGAAAMMAVRVLLVRRMSGTLQRGGWFTPRYHTKYRLQPCRGALH